MGAAYAMVSLPVIPAEIFSSTPVLDIERSQIIEYILFSFKVRSLVYEWGFFCIFE
jgi:hypothetical protein